MKITTRRGANSAWAVGLAGVGLLCLGREYLRSRRRFSLEGRVVVITGGSRGLGLALAREFARHRATIALFARDVSELAAAAADVRAIHHDVHTFACDVRDPNSVADGVRQVKSQCGNIDVLVNNAGTIIVGPAQAMTLKDFHEAMDVNYWGAVNASLAVIPEMRAAGFGRIVNIGSVGGKVPVPHLAPYSASKFALVGFSGAMRAELAGDGILVTNINPGLMRTGSPRNASFKGNHRAEYAWFSVGDAMPGLSMDAAAAARKIVAATINGDAEVSLGFPAKIAAAFHGLLPNLSIELASLVNRALPTTIGATGETRRGYESESFVTRSFVRRLGRRAEQDYNQL